MIQLGTMVATILVMSVVGATTNAKMATQTFPVLAGAGAHDVYPAPDGAVWFTAQSAGKLGRLDPSLTSPIRPAVPRFSPAKSLSGKERRGPKRRKSAVVPTKSILKAGNVPI